MAIDLRRYADLVKTAQTVRVRGRVIELTGLVISSLASSSMHLPLVVDRTTFAFAVAVFAAAALVSGLVVRRRLDELDLIAVLKARE